MFVLEPEVDHSPFDAPTTELVWSVRSPVTSKYLLLCLAKRTYRYSPAGVALADEQDPVVIEPDIAGDETEPYRFLRDDSDLTVPKDATDVVVSGRAYALGSAKELIAAVAVGASARRVRVLGERTAEVGFDGSVRFSDPLPFEHVELTADSAYGGYDAVAHRMLDPVSFEAPRHASDGGPMVGIFAYPRNGAGRGYFIDVGRPRADGAPLPLLEDPTDPLKPRQFFVPHPEAWIDAPMPAHLGWVAHCWYPRLVRLVGPLLPYDKQRRPIRESAFADGNDLSDSPGQAGSRVHPRALQGAAPGLAVERLKGDETVILQHLHPHHEELRFSLPGERPKLAVRAPGIQKTFSAEAVLQTVRVDTVRRVVSLTWAGTVPLAAQARADFLVNTKMTVAWSRL